MTTPTQGEHAQTEAQPIQRFEVVDCIDSKHVPAVIPRKDGPWVRYEDHAAVLRRLHTQVAAITAGNREELAHELFAAAQLAPGEGIEDAVRRIAASLTAAPHPSRVSPEMVDSLERASDTLERLKALGSRLKHLDDTTAQPAAPQGGAYAELPESYQSSTLIVGNDGCTVTFHFGTGDEADVESWLSAVTERASNGQAPAAPVTVEQVEDAIGLQSTAWDTIGAEKIVEAVLRLANGQAPAGAAFPPAGCGIHPLSSRACERGTKSCVVQHDLTTTAQAAPAAGAVAGPWKDHQTREIVNQLRDCAKEFHATQQLRERLLYVLGPMIDWMRAVQAPTPAAPADSVLKDAERYRHLRDCNSGSLAVMQITGTGEDDWCILTEDGADAAIDAASNQGGV